MYVLLNYGEISLRSKRFQSSYCAKGRAGAKKKKKNDGRGRGRGEEETFFSLPLPRHSFFCSRPNFSRRTRAETLATQARRNRIILIQRFIIVAVLIINQLSRRAPIVSLGYLWVFHTNPCKFRNFQTVVKYFLKNYGAQISF